MRNPVVILHTDKPRPALEIVETACPDLSIHTCDSYEALPDKIRQTNAEVIYSVRFAGTPEFPKDALLNSKTLRWISVGGSGIDHIAGWDPSSLTVTNAAGVAAGMMAEYTLGAILHFSLDLMGFARAKAARKWISGKVEPISGRTILILGLGQTGRATAKLCKTVGMYVIGVRAHPSATENVDEVYGVDALPDLWPRADTISVCLPLTKSTRCIVDADAVALMKPRATLIDISRGGVVDQAVLAAALSSGQLRGAAIDVFETEPLPEDSDLWGLQNTILTPHCSSIYDGWENKAVAMFSDNLARYRRGESLMNIVDPDRGY